jgi:hypothetical protein
VCPPPPITFEPVVRSHAIQQGDHAIEGDLIAISFNLVASTILKMADIQTSEVDAKRTNQHGTSFQTKNTSITAIKFGIICYVENILN